MRLDDFGTRPQPEVEGVAENDLGADAVDLARQYRFYSYGDAMFIAPGAAQEAS